MTTCRHADQCRMFCYIRERHVRQDFITRFCQGPERESCARYLLKETGKPVPLDLQPDGTTIAD